MEQEKKPIVWLFRNGENSSSMEHVLNQGGFKCNAFTTEDDYNISIKKERPALIITDSMRVLTKAKDLGIPAVTPEAVTSNDYKEIINKVSQIISKPEQGAQAGMSR
jgi:hypothetical protein